MRYHNITKEDMNNGDGLRTVLWTAGCEHHCPECQNPITWDANGGIEFDSDAVNEIMESLAPSYISGITFSGGDPLATYNRKGVLDMIMEIKKTFGSRKTIWVYTGYTFEQLQSQISEKKDPYISEILDNINVLVDGPYLNKKRDISLKWRGSSNQRVIDVKTSLKAGSIILHCD